MEIADVRSVNSIQMPVRQFFHQKEKFGSRPWGSCRVLVHLLQSRHGNLLFASWWITSVHGEHLWAIIVSVVVGVKHCQRAEQ